MTILCDTQLHTIIEEGVVENADLKLVNPASLDLRLGNTIMIESVEGLEMIPCDIGNCTQEDPYLLVPGQFVLAQTMEMFNLPEELALFFYLKSSRAREGYEHSHAGFGDPGWCGSVLTLELKNNRQLQPLPLWPGLKIGQAVFMFMSHAPRVSYAQVGHYCMNATVTGSVGHV